MAMAICSCSNLCSPSIQNISLSPHYNTDSSHLKVPIPIHSSSNHTTTSTDPFAPHQISDSCETNDVKNEQYWWSVEVKFRRNKRRQRRKIKGGLEHKRADDDDDNLVLVDKNEASKSRFMTPQEEATFSWYLKERARIEGVRTELQVNLGSSSQWAKAARISQHNLDKILCNGRESEDIITRRYHRLVVHVASSYLGRGLSLQDLTQEGNIGLLRGAIRFDPERGYKLSTYAYWWIRQSISKAVANKSKIVRLPGSISELVPKICEANAVLSRKLHRFPTYDEVAEDIDASPRAVRLAIERNKPPISIDQAITSHGCMSLQDIIRGPDETTPDAMVKKDMLRPEIRKLLRHLRDREAHILRLRYGLDGDAPWSFEEIGRLLRISRERVRQINSAALAKLRRMGEIDDLKHFILC